MKNPLPDCGFAVLALCVLCAPLFTQAGVFDDVAVWWHFDYDADSDGLADLDEIRDQRDWGTATAKGAGGRHAQVVAGPLGSPSWTNTAASPAGGTLYGGKSMAFSPVTNATSCWPDTFRITNYVVTGSAYTIVTRFRWDGYAFNSSNPAWLYNNGLLWVQSGWMFGIEGSSLSVISGFAQGSVKYSTIVTGKWYEAAAVITDNGASDTVEFYLWPEGGYPSYSKTTALSLTNTASLATGTIIGAEAQSTGFATGNALKAFKGAVNHIAVWSRALSYSEIREAFGHPQPLIQLGLKNASPYDFGLESEADAEYVKGDPWHTLPRGVTASNTETTIKIPLASYQAKLSQVLHVRTLTWNNNDGGLQLIVNAVTNPPQTAKHLKDLYWYVPTNTLVTGTNSFTLRYASGPSPYVTFDWLEIGGSWQIGYEDGLASEFEHEVTPPDDFYITDPNWKHVERAIANTETNTQLRFCLSEELTRKFYFTYTTRIIGQGNGSDTHAFSVDFNTVDLIHSAPVPNGTYVKLPIPASLVKTGENVIRIRYDDDPAMAGYLQFDFHRLEIKPWPAGSLLRVK